MSRKRKLGDVDWSAVENAREVKRVLALKKDEDACYHCPVINCDHPVFTSKRDVENMSTIYIHGIFILTKILEEISVMKTHQHLVLKIWKRKHALFTCLPIL